MQRYILRRVLQAIVCIIAVSIIVFMLSRLSGDPLTLMLPPEATVQDREALRQQLGLDKPLYTQYWRFISGAARGDLGESLRWKQPIMGMFLERFPNTLQLAVAAMAWALLIGITFGILSAVKVGTWFDNFGKIFALSGQAVPGFWLGLMLILLFAVKLRWLPSCGMGGLQYLVLPSLTLGAFYAAALLRLTRSAMLDVLDSDYIKMARIKGMPEILVILKHAFKNASLPVLTMLALNFVVLLNGTFIIETIFFWPGVGKLVVDAIYQRDFPVIQACALIASILFVFANLVVDILYAYLDPRIRYQ